MFLSRVGDHTPRHVHVYRDGRFLLKWDLENGRAMAGTPTRRILQLIRKQESERML